MNNSNTQEPFFLKVCSISTAAKAAIITDSVTFLSIPMIITLKIIATLVLTSKLLFTGKIVDTNVFQIVVGSFGLFVCLLVGLPTIFKRRLTMLKIFILLQSLAVLLNTIAWIIIVINLSQTSMYEALCNTPGDCPKYFNPAYVYGIIVASLGAVFFLLNLLFLKAYIEYLQFLEKDKRERQQQAEARKRASAVNNNVPPTTDHGRQQQQPSSPTTLPQQPPHSAPGSICINFPPSYSA